jgi:hypothetical protein
MNHPALHSIACTRGARSRGMTMLFLTGMTAVMFLLAFGMWETVVRGQARSASMAQAAQARGIADAGVVYGRLHLRELEEGGRLRRECGAGVFELTLAEDGGTSRIVSRASVPMERSKAVVEVRASVQKR